MAQRHRTALRFVLVASFLAVAAAVIPAARAGTYTFSFQESIVDDRLDGPLVHGSFAALRDTSVTIAGWHGPRVRTTAGGHTAGSYAMLDLVAPSPAKFVQSSIVARYRGCSKEANKGFWMEVSVLVGQSEALGTRRVLPAPDGCTEVPAEHPGSATIARPDRVRFKLGSTVSDSAHAAGTYVLINQISGTIEDVTVPTVTIVTGGASTAAARTVSWSAVDGQAGPHTVTLRVTGPNGFVIAPPGWTGAAAANRACLSGQWISGCQTSVSGAAAFNLPAVTGTYTATVTATDGAGNVAAQAIDLVRVAAPGVVVAPTLGGVAQVGQTLTIADGAFSNVPSAIAYSFYRLQGGVLTLVQTAGASRGYVVGRADHGSMIVGRVTGSNGAGSAFADTPASAVVLPGLPSGGAPVIDGLPAVVDRQLAVVPGTWDNGGAPGAPTVTAVRWYACAAACALVGHVAAYVPTAADIGRDLMAEVDVANAAGTATGVSARTPSVVTGLPTLVAAPTLGGVAQVGQTLTIANGTFTNGPTAMSYRFYRLAGGVLEPVQTEGPNRDYLVGRADHGSTIVGRVTATNAAGSAVGETAASAVVLPALPSGGKPFIDGAPAVVDRQLAIVPGTWDNGGAPGSPVVTAVRWYSCAAACALVGHADTYLPAAADMGRALLAEVDVVNAAGTATGTSARTPAVVAGAPTLVSAPIVSGPARVGETLAALPPVIAGHGATASVALTWFLCRDSVLATCTDRAGTGDTHLIAETDRGLRLRVRADVAGSGGTLVAWSAPTEPVLGRNECLLVAPGTITACVGASSRVTLAASLDRTRVTAGQPVVVRGRITVAGDVARPDRVTVVRAGRAQLAAVDAAGGFALTFVPGLSERVTVTATVAGRGDALVLDAGEVRVVPRITARFTVRRDRGGTVRDLRVAGRVQPRVPVSKFRLLLEGRTPQGRVVGLICRVTEQPVVVEGRYAASCRSRGLPRLARYRVRFLPGPGSPLEAAQTGWQRAALR